MASKVTGGNLNIFPTKKRPLTKPSDGPPSKKHFKLTPFLADKGLPSRSANPNNPSKPIKTGSSRDTSITDPPPRAFNATYSKAFIDLRSREIASDGKNIYLRNVYKNDSIQKTIEGATAKTAVKNRATLSKHFPSTPIKSNLQYSKTRKRPTVTLQTKPWSTKTSSQSAKQPFHRPASLKTPERSAIPLSKFYIVKKPILSRLSNRPQAQYHTKPVTQVPTPIQVPNALKPVVTNENRGAKFLSKPLNKNPEPENKAVAESKTSKARSKASPKFFPPRLKNLKKKSRPHSKGKVGNTAQSKTSEQKQNEKPSKVAELIQATVTVPEQKIKPIHDLIMVNPVSVQDRSIHFTGGIKSSISPNNAPSKKTVSESALDPPVRIFEHLKPYLPRLSIPQVYPLENKKPTFPDDRDKMDIGMTKPVARPERTLAEIRADLINMALQSKPKNPDSDSETTKFNEQSNKGSNANRKIIRTPTQEVRRKIIEVNNTRVIGVRQLNSPHLDGTDPAYKILKGFVSKNHFHLLKNKTSLALREQWTFAVIGGRSYGIETAMKRRGWVQKFANRDGTNYLPGRVAQPPDSESFVISFLMGKANIKFFWAIGYCNWGFVNPGSIVNRFPYTNNSCSTKVGLCRILGDQYWTQRKDEPLVQYPRTFECHCFEDLRYFASNYRINACFSMVRFFLNTTDTNLCGFITEEGKVSLEAIDFALQRLCEFVNFKQHADIDVWNFSLVTEKDWSAFLDQYYDIVHNNEQFKTTPNINILKLIDSCKLCVNTAKPYFPNCEVEGCRNVWIIKPGASGRGRGIILKKTLQGIYDFCKSRNHYVIQKYIEKPLLIHNTKFDIRQWFLVTSITPLIIWMYSDCYLRFSTQKFSLANLHESVHLCNNAIQSKYKNCERSKDLPDENMWDSSTFVNFLSKQGLEDKWMSITLPKMEQAIIGVLLAAQERMIHRANSFTLYGADFMLSEDYSPWLIEINSQPDMGHTTSVTRRMCPEVLEDVCKVVIDRRENEKANTGKFKIIFKQKLPTPVLSSVPSLMVLGKKMRLFMPNRGKRFGQGKVVREEPEHSILGRSLKYEKLSSYKSDVKSYLSKVNPLGYSWIQCEECEKRPLGPGEVVPSVIEPLKVLNQTKPAEEDVGQKYLSINDMKALEEKTEAE